RRHTRFSRDWSSDVCSSDLGDSPARLDTVPDGLTVVVLIDGRTHSHPESISSYRCKVWYPSSIHVRRVVTPWLSTKTASPHIDVPNRRVRCIMALGRSQPDGRR